MTNFGKYFKFICWRERFMSAIWVVCMVGFVVFLVAMYPSIVPNSVALQGLAQTLSTPSMLAMMGPAYAVNDMNQAVAMAMECLVWFLICIAIMNVFLVRRHTRADEELGRLELLIARPVGRLTGALATLTFAFIVNLIISVASWAVILLFNIDGTDAGGAFVFAFAVGAFGFMFAGLTLLLAQILNTASAVTAWGLTLMGVFYLLRAMGDAGDNALSYISPMGLSLKVEAFYSNRIWPLALVFVIGIVFAGVALWLNSIRDIGTGLIPSRKGRGHAHRSLLHIPGLTWRLERSTGIWWAAALFVLGIAYGSVSGSISQYVAGNSMIKQVLNANGSGANALVAQYMSMVAMVLAMVSSVPVIMALTRIKTEERHGRLENILVRFVSRGQIFSWFTVIAFIESLVMLVLVGIGLSISSSGGISLGDGIKSCLVYLPAVWVMLGLAAALVGVLPKLTSLVWLLFVYSIFAVYFGRIINLADWLRDISPFGNIPPATAQDFNFVPLIILTVIAVVLWVVGYFGFKDRDLLTD